MYFILKEDGKMQMRWLGMVNIRLLSFPHLLLLVNYIYILVNIPLNRNHINTLKFSLIKVIIAS